MRVGRKALGRVSLPTFFARAKKVGRSPVRRVEAFASKNPKTKSKNWIPAFAGMMSERAKLDSGLRRNDERKNKELDSS
jgi:hypothetical protein